MLRVKVFFNSKSCKDMIMLQYGDLNENIPYVYYF